MQRTAGTDLQLSHLQVFNLSVSQKIQTVKCYRMTQHLWILVSNLSGSTVKHSYGGNGCCINVFKENRQLYQGIEGQGRSNKEYVCLVLRINKE